MTDFQRLDKSFYLDDMTTSPGDRVICVHDMFENFTPNTSYTVQTNGQLYDDAGTLVVPSARFKMP